MKVIRVAYVCTQLDLEVYAFTCGENRLTGVLFIPSLLHVLRQSLTETEVHHSVGLDSLPASSKDPL